MSILRRILFQAARRMAADPQAQAKAGRIFREDVQPRAAEAWQKTEPHLRAAGDKLQRELGPAVKKVAKTASTVMAQIRKDREDRDNS